jgi:hypothetical protein
MRTSASHKLAGIGEIPLSQRVQSAPSVGAFGV